MYTRTGRAPAQRAGVWRCRHRTAAARRRPAPPAAHSTKQSPRCARIRPPPKDPLTPPVLAVLVECIGQPPAQRPGAVVPLRRRRKRGRLGTAHCGRAQKQGSEPPLTWYGTYESRSCLTAQNRPAPAAREAAATTTSFPVSSRPLVPSPPSAPPASGFRLLIAAIRSGFTAICVSAARLKYPRPGGDTWPCSRLCWC